jgi:hypothetical protein
MTPDEAVEISELASLVARLETKLAEMTARALPLAAENTSHDSYARANYLRRPKPGTFCWISPQRGRSIVAYA